VPGTDELTAKAADAIAQRDAIQANLLELDQSFGKRLLDGAALTGLTRQRWDAASTQLANLWQTFTAYGCVIDRVADIAQSRRPSPRETAELAGLLTGRCVKTSQAAPPLARRDLADSGRRDLTLAAAVSEMRRAFSEVTKVTAAAETVWTEVAGRLDPVESGLAQARPLLAGLDDDLAARVASIQADLERARTQLNGDPLTLWREGRADTSAAQRLAGQLDALAPRIAELDRLRRESTGRITALGAATEAARTAREDLVQSHRRVAARITDVPPLPPPIGDPPAGRLRSLAAAGRWSQLAAELRRCESALAQATSQTDSAERTVASLLGHRDELRGLLDAYKAKAARLGSAEDPDLTARYERAYGLLWTAPCDLTAAADAVTAYQRAILAMEGQRR
jgi:hypothetical protein